jgi:uncharacterized protein (DUF2235 family)
MSDADQAASPPRQLVLCCDGTNNTLTAGRADTNVLRLHEHLARHPASNRLLYYDPGVGAAGGAPPTDPMDWLALRLERIAALASGRGIYDNIGEAYLFLMKHHRSEADQIYLFGFSRGAFTARCVAGMVNLFGIVGAEHEAMLPTLIRIYFAYSKEAMRRVNPIGRGLHDVLVGPGSSREALGRQVRESFTTPPGRDAWVHCVGVWDTVESVGLPGPLARKNPNTASLTGKRVHHVRQALAFDEHRWTFEPRLYHEPDDIDTAEPRQTLRQRWFPGVHCDVGGSYRAADAGLSNEALAWMIDEAIACGLRATRLPPPEVAARAVRHDAIFQTPWWALAGMCLRDMQPRTMATKTEPSRPIAVRPGPTAPPPIGSVWEHQRSIGALVVALLFAALCLWRSGASLTGEGWGGLVHPASWWPTVCAAVRFGGGDHFGICHAAATIVHHRDGGVVWAMVWDLGFIAGGGYLLARIASRAFAWLAGWGTPGMALPAWRVLGFMPLLAVGADVSEDLLTVAAIASDGLGAAPLAWLLRTGATIALWLKLSGLAACVPLVLVRLWIAMPWVNRWPH